MGRTVKPKGKNANRAKQRPLGTPAADEHFGLDFDIWEMGLMNKALKAFAVLRKVNREVDESLNILAVTHQYLGSHSLEAVEIALRLRNSVGRLERAHRANPNSVVADS